MFTTEVKGTRTFLFVAGMPGTLFWLQSMSDENGGKGKGGKGKGGKERRRRRWAGEGLVTANR
jgi:hypothetical protein